MALIGNLDPDTKLPRFSDYEDLFIEQRGDTKKLSPDQVFSFLLDKGVFRVGLSLDCPVCELSFWLSIDDISTQVTCELCGNRFNVTRQLKDRDWKFRRSGLFGMSNNQEGSIPVSLTLQQLETNLHRYADRGLFLTNMLLSSSTRAILPCETDIFVAVAEAERIQIAIGECKDAGGMIELDDAKKLAMVADAFPQNKFDVFIVFSKTAPFTPREIENCRSAQGEKGGGRVIMLSDRELEPYFMYMKTAKKYEVREVVTSLRDMARSTHDIFFAPKRKNTVGGA